MDMVFLLKCHLCVSLCFSCNIMLYFFKNYIYIYIYILYFYNFFIYIYIYFFFFFFFFVYGVSPRRFHFLRARFVSYRFWKLRNVSPFCAT
jgi:hypothetical protein